MEREDKQRTLDELDISTKILNIIANDYLDKKLGKLIPRIAGQRRDSEERQFERSRREIKETSLRLPKSLNLQGLDSCNGDVVRRVSGWFWAGLFVFIYALVWLFSQAGVIPRHVEPWPLLLFILAICLIGAGLTRPRKKEFLSPIQPTPTIVKEKEIIREIVMVPCAYCGRLMPQTATFCPNCGANRKA